jgi:2-deoxy-scyllo-inosamine dehydrogenase (SAM-dependent)
MSDRYPPFTSLLIQTNSRCNLKCPFCFYGQYSDYNSDELISTAVIERLLVQLAEFDYRGRLAFYNMNDPLTDERLIDLLATARTTVPNCFHFLSTNGLLLTQPLLDEIVRYVDVLRIDNYGCIPDLDYSHAGIEIHDRRGFMGRAPSNRGGALANLPAASTPGTRPCANPFGQMVVMPPGVVVLCCSDGFKQHIMGDVRRQRLTEIWHGPRFRAVRRMHATNHRSQLPLCRKCSVDEGGFREFYEQPDRFRALVRTARDASAAVKAARP